MYISLERPAFKEAVKDTLDYLDDYVSWFVEVSLNNTKPNDQVSPNASTSIMPAGGWPAS